ncbi:hypothetical protein [Actinokineospora diospyrosa]|uniref:PH (Pleckstrin Homology) domain-containing protein n=1 Tax=Actinokineospora diospyrosa TaxID=103728 RepID=A0ABT1IAR3_9PSEU|nr:hypothetical protein [Actinokineospora diospyrosa]MCP2269714.1 hypothetical protein [Actinokineospora diospyrosa]
MVFAAVAALVFVVAKAFVDGLSWAPGILLLGVAVVGIKRLREGLFTRPGEVRVRLPGCSTTLRWVEVREVASKPAVDYLYEAGTEICFVLTTGRVVRSRIFCPRLGREVEYRRRYPRRPVLLTVAMYGQVLAHLRAEERKG